MTKPDYTALLFIVDRSGSMFSIYADMEGGIKTLLDDQDKVEGTASVDVVYFDDKYEYAVTNALVADASVKINPRGSTALFDAIVRGTTDFGARLAELPEDERPGKVLVVIVTDGMENSSRENTAADVKRVIEEQRGTYSWEFVFLGANQDAVETAAGFGISRDAALTFAATSQGTQDATMSLSNYTTRYRSGGVASFSDEDRKV